MLLHVNRPSIKYNHSLLALSASILRHYRAKTGHKTLPLADRLLRTYYRNVVLLVFDGMGTAALEAHLPESAFLRRHMQASLSSVFPPTTTAATVTLESGLSPAEHGWLGWKLFFPEIGDNVNLFPNTLPQSEGAPAADFHVAKRYLPYTTLFEKIQTADPFVQIGHVSPFGLKKIENVSELCEAVSYFCGLPGRHYIYGYWPQPDMDMHTHGVYSPEAAAIIRDIDEQVEKLCKGLSDTLVMITADHGLTNVSWRFLPDYPDIMACLSQMPSIEARSMAFFAKPGMEKAFEAAFLSHFGDDFILLPSQEAYESGLFGPGTPHPRTKNFLGNYLALATGHTALEAASYTGQKLLRATHAGLTPEELLVPFCCYEAPFQI